MSITVGQLVDSLDEAFPFSWAEPWDRVGLRIGDAEAEATRAYVTLDPTLDAIAHASHVGADVIVCHHPPFLGDIQAVTAADPAGRIVLGAAAAGISVVAMHTNLDRAPAGAQALAVALGLLPTAPLESALQDMDLVTVYVPSDARAGVVSAMTDAGAGRIGLYESCSFSSAGTGRFTPMPGSAPVPGKTGGSGVMEERVEMITPRGGGRAVAAAGLGVHPYDEPVITVTPVSLARGVARLGRLCEAEPLTLADLAERVGERLGVAPRVWGDARKTVARIAISNGSGSSLLGPALAEGADVMVTGEVRYHDALDAAASGLAIIEAGHDATEWPLVGVLADAVRHALGTDHVVQAEPRIGWWTVGRAE